MAVIIKEGEETGAMQAPSRVPIPVCWWGGAGGLGTKEGAWEKLLVKIAFQATRTPCTKA